MNKTSIKIIKRKDAEKMAQAEPQNACETNQSEAIHLTDDQIERRARREIVDTVSSWITERKQKNRIEEVAAIRKIFGGEPLLSEM